MVSHEYDGRARPPSISGAIQGDAGFIVFCYLTWGLTQSARGSFVNLVDEGLIAMKVVIAPDSFKGSLSAEQACDAIERGLRRVAPGTAIVKTPMADGGEGTADALVASTRGRFVDVRVTGPLGGPVEARYGVLGDTGAVVIEMAAASGLTLVPPDKRNPLQTTSYGTGELLGHALADGARDFIVAIGGSATTDCGTGMAQALGARFLLNGAEIDALMTGESMGRVDAIDAMTLIASANDAAFVVACDVDNPLLGPRGAVHVYSPQKGASPEQCETLETNMSHIIDLIEHETGRAVRDIPGAGAAGGMGAGLMAFLGAKLQRGVEIVIDRSGLSGHVEGADLVITGEGQIDYQTAFGKTISGVARVAREQGVAVVGFAGRLGEGADALSELGVGECRAISSDAMSVEESMARGGELLANAVEAYARERL